MTPEPHAKSRTRKGFVFSPEQEGSLSLGAVKFWGNCRRRKAVITSSRPPAKRPGYTTHGIRCTREAAKGKGRREAVFSVPFRFFFPLLVSFSSHSGRMSSGTSRSKDTRRDFAQLLLVIGLELPTPLLPLQPPFFAGAPPSRLDATSNAPPSVLWREWSDNRTSSKPYL